MPSMFPKYKSPFDWPPSFYQKVKLQGYNYEHLDYSNVLFNLKASNVSSYYFESLITKTKLEIVSTIVHDSLNPEVAETVFSNQPKSPFKKSTNMLPAYNKLGETAYPIDGIDGFRLKVICNTVPGKISLGLARSAIKLDLVQIGNNFRLDFYLPYSTVDVDQPDQDYAMIVGTSHSGSAAYLIKYSFIVLTEANKNVIRKFYKFLFKNARADIDKLAIIYNWAPKFIIDERPEDDLYFDLAMLLSGSVNERGTNEEAAVLNMLASLVSPVRLGNDMSAGNKKAGDMLRRLVDTKVNAPLASETRKNAIATGINKQSTLFALLYNKMNDYGGDNNFTAMINQLYALWLLSEYAIGSAYEIEYTSKKSFGFYFTNYDFLLTDDSEFIEVHAANLTPEKIIEDLTNKETSLNVFAPVSLTSGTEVEVAEQDAVSDFMPAFYLKAIDDKNAAANLETGIFLAVDILTTFTGFGNLLKFRRLFKTLNLAYEGLNTVKILAASKIVISAVEITSGVVGTMITLSNDCDSKFCNSLRSCLFYLELLDLGADVVVSKLLKKSAQKALDVKVFNPNKISEGEYFQMINTLESLAGIKVAEQILRQITKEQAQALVKRYGVGKFISEAQIDTFLSITGERGDLMNNLLLSLKEIIPNRPVKQLMIKFNIKKVPLPNSLTNYQTRIWYTWKKRNFIETEIAKIKNLEDKAKKAFDLRNEYRTAAREYMKDNVWKEFLEKMEKNYTWDEILTKTLNKEDINSLEEAFEEIIQSSSSGRDQIDKLFKIEKE